MKEMTRAMVGGLSLGRRVKIRVVGAGERRKEIEEQAAEKE
jgi:hypothetical protein